MRASYTPQREDQLGGDEIRLPGDEQKLEEYMNRFKGSKTAATRVDVRASSKLPAHHFVLVMLDAPLIVEGQPSALDAIKIDRYKQYDRLRFVNYQEVAEQNPQVVNTFSCAWWRAGSAPSGLPPESRATEGGGPGAGYIISCIVGLFICPPLAAMGLFVYPMMYGNQKTVEREYTYNKDARMPYLYDLLLAFHQRSKATDYPPILKVGERELPVGDSIFYQQCQQFAACLWRQLGKSHSHGIHRPARAGQNGDTYNGAANYY